MTATDAMVPAPSIVPSAPQTPETFADSTAIRFVGRERTYWRLLIRGAVLLLFTLGIYRFWLVTDVRHFLWANTEIAGDRLEYTGTARELLIGFLIAVALLVPLYVIFFIAGVTVMGEWSAFAGFLVLAWFGQFAVYRARRYRLTRSILRGVRFHQTGSARRYAFRAMIWWAIILLTWGLAYPWAQTSLERYKMRNTFYGELSGDFTGSGTRLLVRGIFMWLLVVGPLLVGFTVAFETVNWLALADAIVRGGDNVMAAIESASPNFASAIVIASIAVTWSVIAAAVLYPAFQAMMLRWWTSGLRFGDLSATSRLRIGQVYGIYFRFLGYALLFAIAGGLVATAAIFALKSADLSAQSSLLSELVVTVAALLGYIVLMLGYSTIYQATVRLRLWKLGFESTDLSGIEVLDRVKAYGVASSPFGEGLADALNVGGI